MKLTELPGHVGDAFISPWIVVDQARIDAFADCTEDHTFIHVDPVAAAPVTGTGGTIAHGFLSLSLLGGAASRVLAEIETESGVNYGFDKVRFLAPVPAGSRVRAVMRLTEAIERAPLEWRLRFDATLEIEGQSRPAVAADWLMLNYDFGRAAGMAGASRIRDRP